jgi:hypothetical protein
VELVEGAEQPPLVQKVKSLGRRTRRTAELPDQTKTSRTPPTLPAVKEKKAQT